MQVLLEKKKKVISPFFTPDEVLNLPQLLRASGGISSQHVLQSTNADGATFLGDVHFINLLQSQKKN